LIQAGVRRVVVAVRDPDSRVAGQGIERLRAVGVAVTDGVCAAEALALNRGFFQRLATGRPWVAVKVAASLDGRIALQNGVSQWITGPEARAQGHWLRASFDAILCGTGTIRVDDPELTCRLPGLAGRSPLRILLDRQGRVLPTARALAAQDGPRPWLVTARPDHPAAALAEIITLSLHPGDTTLPLPAVLQTLGERGLTRLLVEGGGRIMAALLQQNLVDEIFWFVAPKLMGGDSLPAVDALHLAAIPPGWRISGRRSLGADQLLILQKD
jgi:diaminohydroxyphosphoribosylaminopyrimidine deaminase/5-amino-6-(5-phosphoribosylamino)uracil reductase